jgi:hypothetical protein
MKPAGGLKLALTAPSPGSDRRVRFAPLTVAAAAGGEEFRLVTDARGRLRYPLAAGDYRLRLDDGGETRFCVRDGRWTPVRLSLP